MNGGDPNEEVIREPNTDAEAKGSSLSDAGQEEIVREPNTEETATAREPNTLD